jgi:hypothetical protein
MLLFEIQAAKHLHEPRSPFLVEQRGAQIVLVAPDTPSS